MAKRRSGAARRSSSGIRVIKMPAPRAAKPIIIRQSAPRAPKHKRRRSHSRSSGGGALTVTRIFAFMLGGAAVSFLQKQFPNLPSVPVVGKKGTIAIGSYFLAKRGGSLAHIARDVCVAAAVLAGEELGRTGAISGDVVPQVHGVASQT